MLVAENEKTGFGQIPDRFFEIVYMLFIDAKDDIEHIEQVVLYRFGVISCSFCRLKPW